MDDMPGPRATNETIRVQLKGLNTQIEDVKKLLIGNEDRIRCLERSGDKTTPLTNKRIEDLETVTKDHEEQLEELRTLIRTQAQTVQKLTDSFVNMQMIWKWALGIFTTVMIAILIMLVTGQAEVIFK